jgi:uncharacterized protein YxjI
MMNMDGKNMRRRREEWREERVTFGQKSTATRSQMRQKLISFGDDFWITNEPGEKVFKVGGKVLGVRGTCGVEVAPDHEDICILTVTVSPDQLVHN